MKKKEKDKRNNTSSKAKPNFGGKKNPQGTQPIHSKLT